MAHVSLIEDFVKEVLFWDAFRGVYRCVINLATSGIMRQKQEWWPGGGGGWGGERV